MARSPEVFDPAAPLNNCEATAAYLGVSRGLVYAQAREGGLPAMRIGSRLMIRTAALLAMLADTSSIEAPADGQAECCGGCAE